MRVKHAFAGLLLLAIASHAAAAIIWDNFISGDQGFDGVYYRSSERNDTVSDSYTGDDAVFSTTVTLTGIEWIGLRRPGFAYTAADAILLNSDFTPIMEFENIGLESDVVLGVHDGLTLYQALVKLPDEIILAPGHYYYAARLVGTGGRNYVAASGAGVTRGATMGIFQSEYFLGTDQWFLLNEVSPRTSDFAYRLHGVPEPSSLLLLAMGGALYLLRRR